MKLPDLNIPPGLEEAFYNVVQFLGGKSGEVYISHKTKPAKKYFSKIAFRSLFVKWKDLYNSFNETRKNSWTAYWLTLPFGGHWGASGYPGSGYSAFVYVNAPRYQSGESLLYDPPDLWGAELVLNGGFDGNMDYWENEGEDPYLQYDDFCLKTEIVGGEAYGEIKQDRFIKLSEGTIKTAIALNVPSSVTDLFIEYGFYDAYDWVMKTELTKSDIICDGKWYSYFDEARIEWGGGDIDVKFVIFYDFLAPSGSVYFDNFSLKRKT